MPTDYGPWFPWFAWHPVNTEDRGWRWLITVNRRRRTHTVPLGVWFHGGDVSTDWQNLVDLP